MRPGKQAGLGLIEVMIAAGLLTVIGLAASRFLSHQFKAQSTLGNLSLLNSARTAVESSFDCRQTLGATPGVLLPCTGATITAFKRKDGKQFSIGTANSPWEFRGRCVAGEFLIETRAKNSKAGAGSIDARTGLRGDWFDLFEGQSELCRSFYATGASPCPAPDEELIGMAGNTPVCGPKRSLPTCSSGQVLTTSASGTPTCISLASVFENMEFTRPACRFVKAEQVKCTFDPDLAKYLPLCDGSLKPRCAKITYPTLQGSFCCPSGELYGGTVDLGLPCLSIIGPPLGPCGAWAPSTLMCCRK